MASKNISPTTAVVLITGGNTGIGLQIASVLSNLPDYHIIIGSRNPENGTKAVQALLDEDASRSLSAVEIDVTSDSSIASAAASISKDFGRVDVLINNAGSLFENPVNPVISRSLFQKTYEVNVFGATAVTEAFLPLLEKCSALPPRLIFISSRMGSLGTRAKPAEHNNFPIYRSSKSALNMIMLHYAALYKEKGWKVNSCAPGFTKTSFGGFIKGGEHGDATGTYLAKAGSVEDASIEAVRFATAGVDGVSGTYSSKEGPLPW
jgi:NAD(P)-dependent dehydrogenase (short-subunit alcohol dehydrogenase family)